MARIRTVKPELFRHEDLFALEQEVKLPVRLAFIGLFTAADRDGRFAWRPRALQLDVLPYDKIDFSRVLDALASRGFVVRYTVAGQDYGYIPSFPVHQVINNREMVSKLPSPSEGDEIHASGTRAERDTEFTQGKGREGKGTGREREGKNLALTRFEDFWSVCPRKIGKGKAEEKFSAAVRAGADADRIIAAMRAYASTRHGEDEKFTVHPATWLSQRRWEDELGTGAKVIRPTAFNSPEEQEAQRKAMEAAYGKAAE